MQYTVRIQYMFLLINSHEKLCPPILLQFPFIIWQYPLNNIKWATKFGRQLLWLSQGQFRFPMCDFPKKKKIITNLKFLKTYFVMYIVIGSILNTLHLQYNKFNDFSYSQTIWLTNSNIEFGVEIVIGVLQCCPYKARHGLQPILPCNLR